MYIHTMNPISFWIKHSSQKMWRARAKYTANIDDLTHVVPFYIININVLESKLAQALYA